MVHEDDEDRTVPPQRLWRQSDRAKISIMQIFRSSFEDRVESDRALGAPERIKVREGVTEAQLRDQILRDLGTLMSTINLDSTLPLDDFPEIHRSILNYGLPDLSDTGETELQDPAVIDRLKQALIDHEPRLLPETVQLTVRRASARTDRRATIHVEAEMIGDPVDIPIDFDAEIDTSAGKMRIADLRVKV